MKNICVLFICVLAGLAPTNQSQCQGLPQFVFVTPDYSNAVLKATLPHFTEFAERLKLNVLLPIDRSQVKMFRVNPGVGIVGGWLVLTNNYEMWFTLGVVDSFRTPRNYFEIQNFANASKFHGRLRMTKDDAVAMAKQTLRNLGYKLEDVTHDWPMTIKGPWKDGTNVIPFFEVRWENPEDGFHTYIDIDAENETVVGLFLDTKTIRRPNPPIDVVPQINSNYWKHAREHASQPTSTNSTLNSPGWSKMSFNTNAPAIFRRPSRRAEADFK